ncbi:MAG: hypothetical protein V4857_15350 [Pseudomonadota bacterium]
MDFSITAKIPFSVGLLVLSGAAFCQTYASGADGLFARPASTAPDSAPSAITSSHAKFVVGLYIGTFNSEAEAFAGWSELPAGSKPEGAPVALDDSAKLVGLRPPPNTTDLEGLVYMILMTLPDGRIQSFFTVPENPWIESREMADQFVRKLHESGSTKSRLFVRQ